jgi:hypothetical protein
MAKVFYLHKTTLREEESGRTSKVLSAIRTQDLSFQTEGGITRLVLCGHWVGSYTESIKQIHQKVIILAEMNRQLKIILLQILSKSARSVHIYLLVYVVWENIVIVTKMHLEIFWDSQYAASQNATKWFLEWHLSPDLSSCMCALLRPERLNGFESRSVFKSLFIIGLCLINTNILATKRGILINGPETHYFYFFGISYKDFDYISIIYGNHGPT